MKRCLVIVLSFLSYGLVQAKDSMRIASYNFENFWDSDPDNTDAQWKKYIQTLPQEEQKSLRSSLQYESYSKKHSNWYEKDVLRAKIDNVIAVLEMAKLPDIVGLQEVESANNTSTVFDTPYGDGETFRTKLAKLGYKHIYLGQQEEENPVSVTTAFISKVALEVLPQVKIESPGHSGSARDLQAVALYLEHNERVVIFNNHWKSKRSGSEEIRVETARKLAARIAEERKSSVETHIIVLGDLNSAYHERPLETLGTTKDKSLFYQKKDTHLLYNLWYEKAPKDRWESSFNGVRGTLSHILISGSLFKDKDFHYEDSSFEVIGHTGKAKEKMIDVSGVPYRWQIRFFYSWNHHMKRGYSDHLPLVASFKVNSEIRPPQHNKRVPRESHEAPDKIFFNEIEPCKEEEAIDLMKIRYQSEEDLDRKCVKIDLDSFEEPLELHTRGKYSQNYIKLPFQGRSSKKERDLYLGITMVGRYNWRPNLHDPRINYVDAAISAGKFNGKNWHPHSNKCFVRKVLQRPGGKLRKVMGRAGFSDGYFSIHIASRQDVVLEDLPFKKRSACPW